MRSPAAAPPSPGIAVCWSEAAGSCVSVGSLELSTPRASRGDGAAAIAGALAQTRRGARTGVESAPNWWGPREEGRAPKQAKGQCASPQRSSVRCELVCTAPRVVHWPTTLEASGFRTTSYQGPPPPQQLPPGLRRCAQRCPIGPPRSLATPRTPSSGSRSHCVPLSCRQLEASVEGPCRG